MLNGREWFYAKLNHESDNIFRTNSIQTTKLNHNAHFLTITWKSSFARINTNRHSAHNIRSHQLHNFVDRYNEFGNMHFPVLKKNVVLTPFSNHTITKICSRYFAGTGYVCSADTWRKEFKSRTYQLGEYFRSATKRCLFTSNSYQSVAKEFQ